MLKRPHYIALSLVIVFVLVVLNLPNQTASQAKLVLSGAFLPLFGLAGSIQNLGDKAGTALTPRNVLVAEIDRLRRDNQQYKLREMQLSQIWRENDRLRQALNWQRQAPWKLRSARVTLRDPANWWRSVQINVGLKDGVLLDTPVLSPQGLVGRVRQVGENTARVALVGDEGCRVSAVVEEGAAKDYGVISSGSWGVLDMSLVDLTYVNRPTAVKAGQRVLTSGLGGIFPKGILIGHIVDTNNVGFGLYIEARVKLSANLDNLEEVWVVIP